jgi:hypothetical protein
LAKAARPADSHTCKLVKSEPYYSHMFRQAALPVGLLAVVYSLLLAAPGNAQFPPIPKGCSPPSGLLDLRDPSVPKVTIEHVDFDGPIHLPDSALAQAIADLNDQDWNARKPDWVDWFVEVGLKGAWQDRGYYKVQVAAEAHSLGGDAKGEKFLVTAHVTEGLQYHLGDLQFVNARPGESLHVSESQLRTAFPLREGELFNVGLVREGIEELTNLYVSQGYIDITATPEVKTDDKLQRASLVFDLDEQRQFRVGTLQIVGLDPSLEGSLRAAIRPGEIFSGHAIDDFLSQYQLPRPPGASLDVRRDARAGLVDLMLDFRPCPPVNSR